MSPSDAKGKPSPAANDAGSRGAAANPHERPCPECGEGVRRGLVRCWNCGAFMEKSLQARYQEMQQNPAPTIFSQVPADEMVSVDAGPDDDDSEDFQLSIGAAPTGGRVEDLKTLESSGATKSTAATEQDSEAEAGPQTAHSVATGGDVLFQAALQEEAESKQRRRRRPVMLGGAKTAGGFIIFCPYGCRIEVKEQHRGMQGRCPRCKTPFLVPVDPPDFSAMQKAAAEQKGAKDSSAAPGGYKYWLDDLHVHTVPPEKLKLKADSLLKDFAEQDFAFGPDGILIINLGKKSSGGLFGSGGGGDKQKADLRAAAVQHLRDGKSLSDLPVGEQRLVKSDQVQQLRVVEPAASRAESVFHGIPVFGAGRIAVQLPAVSDGPPQYVSMGVMQFRKFAEALADLYGMTNFGDGRGIPAAEEFVDQGKCHYLGTPVKSVKNLEFYQADPTVEVILAGWKCAACSMVVSEDARTKEKMGGKGGKGLAKLKCPKCLQKFGEQPLYTIKESAVAPAMSEDESTVT